MKNVVKYSAKKEEKVAVAIRLKKMGTKKKPVYRIIVCDSRVSRDGKIIEAVGFYDPVPEKHKIEIKRDRISYWLKQGAKASQTVKSILYKQGVKL